MQANTINPYGGTKVMVELTFQDFGRGYDLDFISLRYFYAAGADPGVELGEVHVPETHLIPSFPYEYEQAALIFSVCGEEKGEGVSDLGNR